MRNWINSNSTADSIVLNSKITLSRNIDKKVFPSKMNFLDGRENVKPIYNILEKELEDDELVLFEMWNNSEDSYKKYIEQGLITEKLVKNSNKAAFILNKEETVSIMINEEDHIKIQCITAGLNLNDVFSNAYSIDDSIESKVSYAFDEKLGYLTSEFSKLGTGLTASVIIHLPALTMNKEIDVLTKDFKNLGIKIESLYSKDNKPIGNLYVITNINEFEINETEEEIINKVKNAVLSLVSEEKKYREILISKAKYELEDKVFRAYGIIKNAVLLDFSEMLDLLSNVRLGVELSLLDINKNKLNEILANTSDFSLQSILKSQLNADQLKYERCKIIKEILV